MSLREALLRRIAAEGPISLADYMAECLLHPRYGYYTTRDPLGASGDFITAPEISQMFGELVGLALVQAWLDQGRPTPFVLAELGPGRGTLMGDALRAAAVVPQFAAAARLVLVEASQTLRDAQAQSLRPWQPAWVDRVEDLPQGPLFLIANEFFDALPVRQFLRDSGEWRERRIGATDGQLLFGLGPRQAQPGLDARHPGAGHGDMVCDCAPATAIAEVLGARIAATGGAALIVDYGDWQPQGDTFQAVRDHRPADPLAAPGSADLTAHVDFAAIARAARPAAHGGPVTQGRFLEQLGIAGRAARLAAATDVDGRAAIASAYRRLTDPAEMGNLFKVLALHPEGTAPPPGLLP